MYAPAEVKTERNMKYASLRRFSIFCGGKKRLQKRTAMPGYLPRITSVSCSCARDILRTPRYAPYTKDIPVPGTAYRGIVLIVC